MKQKGDLDDAWEISAFLTYFQENRKHWQFIDLLYHPAI